MIKRLYSKKKYKYGTKFKESKTGKIYIVQSCIDLNWLTGGKRKDFYLTLKEVYGSWYNSIN